MKQIFTIFYCITAIAVISACSNYLENPPENKSSLVDTDFSKTENMVLPVNGVYALFNRWIYTWKTAGFIVVRGDDVVKGYDSDQAELGDADKFNYKQLPSFWMTNTAWVETYTIARSSNSAQIELDNYAKYLTTDADKQLNKRLKAEVRVLSAFAYLQLTRLWGDFPVIRDNNQVSVPLLARAEVYRYIISEMELAIPDLPDARPNQLTDRVGAVTKYTALAVKAMAHLDLGEYQKVADATAEIINSGKFELYSDYYQLFKIPGKLSNESLLELQFSDFGQGTGSIVASDNTFNFFGPQDWTPKVSGSSSGWGFCGPSFKYIKFMIDRGETDRLETSVLFTPRGIDSLRKLGYTVPSWIKTESREGDKFYKDVNSTTENPRLRFFSGKYYTPSTQLTTLRTGYGDNNNVRIIRYADILLMYAEALSRGASVVAGQNLKADQAVNLVRARAKMPLLSGVTTDQIIEERLAELGQEWGIRYADLIRIDKASTELDGFQKGVHEFYPIPQPQLDVNPLLKK